jgi:hypothetical protein
VREAKIVIVGGGHQVSLPSGEIALRHLASATAEPGCSVQYLSGRDMWDVCGHKSNGQRLFPVCH